MNASQCFTHLVVNSSFQDFMLLINFEPQASLSSVDLFLSSSSRFIGKVDPFPTWPFFHLILGWLPFSLLYLPHSLRDNNIPSKQFL